jgi:hypothetical protein
MPLVPGWPLGQTNCPGTQRALAAWFAHYERRRAAPHEDRIEAFNDRVEELTVLVRRLLSALQTKEAN